MLSKINKRGGIAIEILIMLVVVVVTSAIIFLLVSKGVVSVKADAEQEPLLNTEFIPAGRSGSLAIKEFSFCSFVRDDYQCIGKSKNFPAGKEIYFVFVVESSPHNGQVILVENYRLKDPSGRLLLDVDQKNDFNFEIKSREQKELIAFKDYFILNTEAEKGEYTLELVMENPLLDKKATTVKTFVIN
tara:strand:+ start:93 stop:656 length:564 start_codon:yes stop_codon:yes gene_type:complete